MKLFIQALRTISITLLLTVFTQIGGLIYLIYKPVGIKIQKSINGPRSLLRILVFIIFYLVTSQLITPFLAEKTGRTALPITHVKLKPGNSFIWLANRHYVKNDLLELLLETSNELPKGMSMVYLDANFPFIDGFPLIGHLSHDDGGKIDLAFIYSDSNGNYLNDVKSFSGYGIVELPNDTEHNQPQICEKQGYWQYSITTKFTVVERHKEYQFDNRANKLLMTKLSSDPRTGKIFIEPHLRDRLKLSKFAKIRYHGCHAARHDDHIHLQL